ncbi:TIGR03086 family metal-binding protein [Nonomuraea sp. NPDC048826]|uniref:TIGR03086 family metal-binding protein n=1 Tax=Nonomuraea sp. NPDC048826 TaxID=3364347 RepID=UPI003715282D
MDIHTQDSAALDLLDDLVGKLTDEQLTAPTPCAGWTVRDLVDHMNTEHEAITHALLPASEPLDADPRVAFAQATSRWRAAFGRPGVLEEDVHLPGYGIRLPCRQVLSVHLADMLTHYWDIGRAIDHPVDLPADLLSVAVPIARALPADGPLRGHGRAYASPVVAPDGGSLVDELVAALGRSPSWRAPR